VRVVGLISGTSFDGIDAAAADLTLRDDHVLLRPLGASSVPYAADLRAALVAAMPPSPTTAAALCALDTRIGQAFADTAAIAVQDVAGGEADLVVSHGQTLFHWVEGPQVLGTLQIGQPAWIAERTGLPVVADLRVRDVAAGGQGAPLASLFDVLLLGRPPAGTVCAALNLGGIANLTIVARDQEPLAFDVGPANALLDAAVTHLSDGTETYDRDGVRAARGEVHPALLERLLADPYYALPPPKTTGKECFHLPYLLDALTDSETISSDDLVATVTALTAVTVAQACRQHRVTDVVAAGGGTANPTLMRMLGDELAGTEVRTIDDLGIPSDAKEAYAFALLGFLTVHGLPGTVPSCTGAVRSSLLGCLLPGPHGFAVPAPAATAPTRLRVLTEASVV
jgi:anhydro-N-acetylmuramic acid kinase